MTDKRTKRNKHGRDDSDGSCMTPEERRQFEEDVREDARKFILDSLDAGAPALQILDDLASFYDGDIVDLF